jgi:hypothetical protein
MPEEDRQRLYFTTYSGVKLPLNLVGPIDEAALANRNTYIRAYVDGAGVLLGVEKIVYGEVEMSHRYHYDEDGGLRRAEIVMPDEEPTLLRFDASGALLAEA